jgi:hypothetical protein
VPLSVELAIVSEEERIAGEFDRTLKYDRYQ